MRFGVEVRCLKCGTDDLLARPDEHGDALARATVACPRCEKMFRLNLTMVAVRERA